MEARFSITRTTSEHVDKEGRVRSVWGWTEFRCLSCWQRLASEHEAIVHVTAHPKHEVGVMGA